MVSAMTLIAAILGGLVAAVFTQIFTNKRERLAWLRTQRITANQAFLGELHHLMRAVGEPFVDVDITDDLWFHLVGVELVSGREVRRTAQAAFDAMSECLNPRFEGEDDARGQAVIDTRKAHIAAVRQELS